MFPMDELTPFCPGERKALEAGDVDEDDIDTQIDDETPYCNWCGEDVANCKGHDVDREY